jgi:hypothetical protein
MALGYDGGSHTRGALAGIGEAVWQAACAVGRRMTLEQAAAYALGADEAV